MNTPSQGKPTPNTDSPAQPVNMEAVYRTLLQMVRELHAAQAGPQDAAPDEPQEAEDGAC